MKIPQIHLTIPAQAEYIDIVRLTLYGVAHKVGFSYEEIEDMKVAVSEACTNAVLHAYDSQHLGLLDITFDLDQDEMCITVKDTGSSFQHEETVNKSVSLHNQSLDKIVPGGLGIYMMHVLMDSVEFHTDLGTE